MAIRCTAMRIRADSRTRRRRSSISRRGGVATSTHAADWTADELAAVVAGGVGRRSVEAVAVVHVAVATGGAGVVAAESGGVETGYRVVAGVAVAVELLWIVLFEDGVRGQESARDGVVF